MLRDFLAQNHGIVTVLGRMELAVACAACQCGVGTGGIASKFFGLSACKLH